MQEKRIYQAIPGAKTNIACQDQATVLMINDIHI